MQGNNEWTYCTDAELPKKWDLLKNMNLAHKVIDFKKPGYTILRVPGPKPSRIKTTGGPMYLIPIQIVSGHPMIEGRPLTLKRTTYVHRDQAVELTPDLYILLLVGREEENRDMTRSGQEAGDTRIIIGKLMRQNATLESRVAALEARLQQSNQLT
ncbi:MAG: hypothetical protein Q9218_002383 [Villophora microphyllina]